MNSSLSSFAQAKSLLKTSYTAQADSCKAICDTLPNTATGNLIGFLFQLAIRLLPGSLPRRQIGSCSWACRWRKEVRGCTFEPSSLLVTRPVDFLSQRSSSCSPNEASDHRLPKTNRPWSGQVWQGPAADPTRDNGANRNHTAQSLGRSNHIRVRDRPDIHLSSAG